MAKITDEIAENGWLAEYWNCKTNANARIRANAKAGFELLLKTAVRQCGNITFHIGYFDRYNEFKEIGYCRGVLVDLNNRKPPVVKFKMLSY